MTHTYRIVKTTLTLTTLLILITTIAALIYLNKIGFPGPYGNWLRQELAHRGIHLRFDSLRFDPRHGLIATNVSFFNNEENHTPLLEAKKITLDLDKSKALRGQLKLHHIHITQGSACIPIAKKERHVTAHHLNGTIIITENGRARIQNATGLIEGIHLTLSTDLHLGQLLSQDHLHDPAKDQDQHLHANPILSPILDELALWTIPPQSPPQLSFKIKGSLNHPDKITTTFTLQASHLTRNDYHLNKLTINGDLQNQLITLDKITLEDQSGTASGQADWSTIRREGRFNLTSALQIQDLLKNCFHLDILKNLTFHSAPKLKMSGTYHSSKNKKITVRASGQGQSGPFHVLETPYEKLTSDFSWHHGDLYFRDLEVKHRKGQINGSLLLENGLARYDLRSTLPLTAFQPFIKKNGPLAKITEGFKFTDHSVIALDAIGTSDRSDLTSWSALGKVHLTNFSYQGTHLHHLSSDFHFIPGAVEFSRSITQLNDEKENTRLRFNAPPSSEIYADRILYDPETELTTISNLRGKTWPTPIVRIFAPKVATHLGENYRFHRPPHLTVNGTFASRIKDSEKTQFSVNTIADGRTDYPFLGKHLPLYSLKADTIVRGNDITVKNLTCKTLDGFISGSIFADVTPSKKTNYQGNLKWDQLSFPLISEIYQFDEEEQGTLTGSIDFKGNADGIRSFNASGLLGIQQGKLVSLPILGPLSPLIAGVLGNKRTGYEHAKNASANFAIINGVAQTKDFIASSTNITLTGQGTVDLLSEQINMTVRMNARGLLGLIALPLKPLKGLFQFRGSGTYSDPTWRLSPFTRPPKGQTDPLFQKASKAQIVPQ